MAYANHKNAWKDELWNVSLLPTVKVTRGAEPPLGPGPGGGKALEAPALLFVRDAAAPTPTELPKAA